MKDWATEVLEQAAMVSILGRSSSPMLRRLGLIICDNAFEFAMKAFVEFDSRIISKTLSFSDWKKNYKGNFEKVVGLVLSEKPGAFDRGKIMRYHGTRSDLYHEAKPLTVGEKACRDYVSEVMKAVNVLFGEKVNSDVLAVYEVDALKAIAPKVASTLGLFVEAELPGSESDSKAICAVIHLFHQKHGRAPTRKELVESLSRCGHSIANRVLNALVYKLRQNNCMERDRYALKAKGRSMASSLLRSQ